MSEVTETLSVYNSLSTYFQSMISSVQLSNASPNPSTLVSGMLTDELLTYSVKHAESGSSYAIGAAQESISTAESILRELDIAGLTKSSIYNNILSNYADEARFYKETGMYNRGVLTGSPTSGSQS